MVNNFDFFPLNRALSLENEEDSDEQRMEHLQQQIDYLVTKMKEQVRTLNLLPHLPILGSSSDSAANKNMMSKIWTNGVQLSD